MKQKINNLTICYLLYLTLLFLCGSVSGSLYVGLKFVAFLLPFVLGLLFMRDEEDSRDNYLSVNSEKLKLALPLVAPTVLAVMLISVLTSLIINLVSGAENGVDVGNALVPALISHAIIPAIFEEMLFRYLPMRMLRGCSKGAILLVSAILFALVHHSFFSFGYAFVAGVIFMAIDLALDSVIPSILIHFINNALSVGMLVYKDNEGFAPAIYALVVILSVLSFAIIIANKKKYKEKFASIFKVEERIPISMPIISFALVCVAMAVFSIL